MRIEEILKKVRSESRWAGFYRTVANSAILVKGYGAADGVMFGCGVLSTLTSGVAWRWGEKADKFVGPAYLVASGIFSISSYANGQIGDAGFGIGTCIGIVVSYNGHDLAEIIRKRSPFSRFAEKLLIIPAGTLGPSILSASYIPEVAHGLHGMFDAIQHLNPRLGIEALASFAVVGLLLAGNYHFGRAANLLNHLKSRENVNGLAGPT